MAKLTAKMTSPRARFIALVLFLLVAFLMGGSSRSDVQSLIFLRPLAVLFGTYALVLCSGKDLKELGAPLYLLIGVLVMMAIQLIPLPPSLWMQLPLRETTVAIAEIMQVEQPWRPLTFSPSKTWNSLFSLVVPIAAILLFAIQDRQHRGKVIPLIIIFGMISAIWAMLQISGPARGPLYLYRLTNNGFAVGLFANRNHQGVFLGCIILANAWYFSTLKAREQFAGIKSSLSIGSIMLLVPVIFVAGSRAGLLIGGLALLFGTYFVTQSSLIPEKVALGRKLKVRGRWLVAGFVAALGGLILTFITFSRSLALDRLIEEDGVENLRVNLLPIFGDMTKDFFPFGTGLGAFEYVYKIYEPVDFLEPRYLNLAHNDWAQWLIEGGLMGVILLALFIIWYVLRSVQTFRLKPSGFRSRQLMIAAIIAFWGIASIFDYPLRAPSLIAVFAIFCVFLERSNLGERR